MATRVGTITNQLLASLPTPDYRRILPHLEVVTLRAGERLFAPALSRQFAYFPTDSIVSSSYVAEAGVMAMVGSVGREGVLGLELPLGIFPQGNRADVQFGGLALRIAAVALQEEWLRGGALQQLLLRYLFAMIAQSSQLAVCNQHHVIEQRFCRFLSSLFEQLGENALFVTQAQLAAMMGVRRETITEIAARLKADNIIQYNRGHLRLVCRAGLLARACGCGAIIRDAFSRVTIVAAPLCPPGRRHGKVERRISGCVERRKSIRNAVLN